ncbi:MAG: aminotransferase class V-fold PLP-dependent enzyme, partial [Candidatus Cloacimonadota bacterium]|nr:aminotransferase class V-fold PLP-dependent enzyme [Candidatus Cloacimonadota bacterium]
QRILGIRLPEKFEDKLELAENDRPVVIITHREHHSNQTSWLETICDVEIITPDINGEIDLECLKKLLKKYEDRPIKIASITDCSNVTGLRSPIHKIAKIMHENGGLCFVDYACSAPYVPINMHPKDKLERLDAIFFSPHKFLGGPGSAGVLIFDEKLYKNRRPDNPGGGTVLWTNAWQEQHYFEDIEVREDGGTPAFLQTIRSALTIKLKEKIGMENIINREEELLKIIFQRLSKIDNLTILEGEKHKRLGVVSFYIEELHHNLIVKILNDRYGIQMRGGCACAGTYGHYLFNINRVTSKEITDMIDHGNLQDKPGWVRFSINPIMTNDEIISVTEALREIAQKGVEFSKDYEYDEHSNEYNLKEGEVELDSKISDWFRF